MNFWRMKTISEGLKKYFSKHNIAISINFKGLNIFDTAKLVPLRTEGGCILRRKNDCGLMFSCLVVKLGPIFKSQVQGLDQSRTLKHLLTTHHHPPTPNFERFLSLGTIGSSYLICRPI